MVEHTIGFTRFDDVEGELLYCLLDGKCIHAILTPYLERASDYTYMLKNNMVQIIERTIQQIEPESTVFVDFEEQRISIGMSK